MNNIKRKFNPILVLATMLFFVSSAVSVNCFADDADASATSDNLMDLSLSELLNTEITVASGSKSLTVTDSPGIVTVIDSAQIERTGARDLVDILRTVPGFDIEYDLGGTLGIGMRGIWANEGRVLVLVDGIEMNDDLYAAFNPGSRIPVALIDRIEIIRGPGSAMYGGSAALAVVSIHTKTSELPRKVFYHAGGGVLPTRNQLTLGHGTSSFYYGEKREHSEFSLSAAGIFGHLSNQTSRDAYGVPFDTSADSVSSIFVNGHAKLYGLDMRLLINNYSVDYTYPHPDYNIDDYTTRFDSIFFKTQYEIKASDRLTITPLFLWKRQQPWRNPVVLDNNGNHFTDWEFHIVAEKYLGGIHLNWQALDNFNVSGGVEADNTKALDKLDNGYIGSTDHAVAYQSFTTYLQGILTSKVVDVTLGARFHLHEQYGPSFVPRLALTKSFENFHIKLIGAMAYKAPSLLNIEENPEIKPERTRTLELELGIRNQDFFMLTANTFLNRIDEAMVYTVNNFIEDTYENNGTITTFGAETSGRFRFGKADWSVSYAYYRVITNDIEDYTVPQNEHMSLGFPAHKVSSALSLNLYDELFFTPNILFLGPKWGVASIGYNDDTYYYKKYPSELLLNVTLSQKNIGIDGLSISMSVYNLLNEHTIYIEPYSGYEPHHPGLGREFMLTLTLENI